MEVLGHTVIENMNTVRNTHSDHLGLISEMDFFQPELHGFEVDLSGNVITPELCPKPNRESNGHRALELFPIAQMNEATICWTR